MDASRLELAQKLARRELAMQLALNEENKPVNPASSFGTGVNKVIMETAGLPADLGKKIMNLMAIPGTVAMALGERAIGTKPGVEKVVGGAARTMTEPPALGSEQLTKAGETAGIINTPEVPVTGWERAGRFTGGSLTGFGAIGTAARMGKTAGLFGPVIESFARAPKTTTAIEAISTTGAAAGGQLARNLGEGNEETKQLVGELIGGFTAPTAITFAMRLPTFQLARKLASITTKAGKTGTAAMVAKNVVDDPALTLYAAKEFEALPGAKFTLGEQAADQKLIALEKAVAKKVPSLADDMLNNREATNDAVRNALTNFIEKTPEAQNLIGSAREHFVAIQQRAKNALNARLAAAVISSRERINRIRPTGERVSASEILNDELEGALKDARAQERIIWRNLPDTEELSLREVRANYDEYIGEQTAIPGFVREFIKKTFKGEGKKMQDTALLPFKDIKEFRTRILRAQMDARASGRADISFFLQRINEGLINDIEASAIGDEFRIATGFSRELNNRFTRGRVGRAMRFAPAGGRAISPEMMSEEIMPVTPTRAAEGIGATMRAAEPIVGGNFEQQAVIQRQQRMQNAMQEVIRNRIFKGTGEFDRTAAKNLVEKKGEVIGRFPQLREQILAAIESDEGIDILRKRISTAEVNLADKRRSALALITNGREDTFMGDILRSPQRMKYLTQAVKSTEGRDPDAYRGMQDAYIMEGYKSGITGNIDREGEHYLSGDKLRKFYNATRKDALDSGLMSKEQMNRFDVIIKNAERMEISGVDEARALTQVEGEESLIHDFIARMIGAKLGQRVSGGGLGSSMVVAGAGSRLVRNLINRIPQGRIVDILAESIRDPNKFKILMETPTINLTDKTLSRLHSYLVGMGMEIPSLEEQ